MCLRRYAFRGYARSAELRSNTHKLLYVGKHSSWIPSKVVSEKGSAGGRGHLNGKCETKQNVVVATISASKRARSTDTRGSEAVDFAVECLPAKRARDSLRDFPIVNETSPFDKRSRVIDRYGQIMDKIIERICSIVINVVRFFGCHCVITCDFRRVKPSGSHYTINHHWLTHRIDGSFTTRTVRRGRASRI